MSSDADDIASTAADEIDARGWQNFIRDYGLGGIFLAMVYVIINGIQDLGTTFMAPFRSFASGVAGLIDGTFGAPIRVLDAGATATVTSFTDGMAAFLGPAAMPVAMVSVVATLYIFQRFWTRVSFSPIDFLRNAR